MEEAGQLLTVCLTFGLPVHMSSAEETRQIKSHLLTRGREVREHGGARAAETTAESEPQLLGSHKSCNFRDVISP